MYVPITFIHTVHLATSATSTLLTPCAMPRNKAEASARAQKKVALQSEVMPEVKRSKRSNEDAVFPMNKRDAQRDVTRAAKQIAQGAALPTNDAERKRREREDAAQAQAAKKVKLQDAVFPTSNAERKKESYEPSYEAHGGSREHA